MKSFCDLLMIVYPDKTVYGEVADDNEAQADKDPHIKPADAVFGDNFRGDCVDCKRTGQKKENQCIPEVFYFVKIDVVVLLLWILNFKDIEFVKEQDQYADGKAAENAIEHILVPRPKSVARDFHRSGWLRTI